MCSCAFVWFLGYGDEYEELNARSEKQGEKPAPFVAKKA